MSLASRFIVFIVPTHATDSPLFLGYRGQQLRTIRTEKPGAPEDPHTLSKEMIQRDHIIERETFRAGIVATDARVRKMAEGDGQPGIISESIR